MNTVKRYQTLPVVKEAIQFDGTWDTCDEIEKFLGTDLKVQFGVHKTYVNLMNGQDYPLEILIPTIHVPDVIVSVGDWIIKQNDEDFYPVSDKVFREKYTEVVEISESQLVYQELSS